MSDLRGKYFKQSNINAVMQKLVPSIDKRGKCTGASISNLLGAGIANLFQV